ncbi:MAG: hypothetical protein ACKOAG_08950 [Candidatus Kapaibacterium sp.]
MPWAACDNLHLPQTYDKGPCGDMVDTTNTDASIFVMPRTDVVVDAGSQQQFWPDVQGLQCSAVFYRLSRPFGSVDATGLYTAPATVSGSPDSVLLLVQSAAKRSLIDTIVIHVRTAVDSCDLGAVTYSGTIEPLMQEHCTGCHSEQSYVKTGGGVLLERYEDVRLYALQGRLTSTMEYASPYKMPKNSLRLGKCSVDVVKAWIAKGAPND